MKIAGDEPDVILITEVIPKAQTAPIGEALISIPGFTLYTNFDLSQPDLGSSGFRGVSIYIRTSLQATEIAPCPTTFIEQLWVQLPLANDDKLLIGCVYRSPSLNTRDGADELCRLLHSALESGHSHVLIGGDFNMPQIDWESGFSPAPPLDISHKFLEALDDCFLRQQVSQPTRFRPGETPHILDLILANEDGMVRNLKHEAGLGKSDHVILRFDLFCYTCQQVSAADHPNYFKGNPQKFIEMVQDADWDSIEPLAIEAKHQFIMDCVRSSALECFPGSKRKNSRKNIYINGQALRLKKEKERLWAIYSQTQNILDFTRYTRCRNQLRALTRRLRRDFEEKLVKNLKTNPKVFWRYSNSRLRTKAGLDNLIDASGSIVCDDSGKAQLLNTFFSSVFTDEDLSHIPEPTSQFVGTPIDTVPITAEAVRHKLDNLKTDAAPGPDGLHPKLLQLASAALAGPLSNLYRESLEQGILPSIWKSATVVPIHKKGSRSTPGNYRPISLTSIPCKVMESLVRDELVEFLTSTGQLSRHQHGFRPRRSCSSQLLEVLEDWTNMLEQGVAVDVAYLDFRKAFDAVPHIRLMKKLRCFGISGKLLKWIEAFLSGRKQEVVVNGSHSKPTAVRSGVPQGSVLGPLLFLLFVNDIPSVVDCSVKMFADDTKLYRTIQQESASRSEAAEVVGLAVAQSRAGRDHPTQHTQPASDEQNRNPVSTLLEADAEGEVAVSPNGDGRYHSAQPSPMQLARDPTVTTSLQGDIDALVAWSDRWQLPFNEGKCKILHLGRNNPRVKYAIRGVELEVVETERDLGVFVDSSLKFRKQAAAAAAKANQILGIIKRSFELIDKSTLPLLYKSLVRPHLEYGNVAWGPFSRADQLLIERVQRRATRLVTPIRHLPYEERLQSLRLPSLFYRRRRGDMIQMYQLFHGGVDLAPEEFFTAATDGRTRGHSQKVQKPRATTRPRRKSFSVRAVNDWNGLPQTVVDAANIEQFKSRLDAHWANIRYMVPDRS